MAKTQTAVLEAVEVSMGKGNKPNASMTRLPLNKVHVNPVIQPRKQLGDVTDLSAGISKDDLLHPLVVRPQPGKEGHYEIVCGGRRYKAVKELGWDAVPVTIRFDLEDDLAARAVAVAENSRDGRHDLTPLEEGAVYKDMEAAKKGINVIAKECGVNHQRVRRVLAILNAPKFIQDKVESGALSLMSGVTLSHLSENEYEAVADQVKDDMSAADVKKLVKKSLAAQESAADDSDDTTSDDGNGNGKKGKGKSGPVMTAWMGNKAKQSLIAELAYTLANADESDVGTVQYHEVRGGLGILLLERGDLDAENDLTDGLFLPPLDPETAYSNLEGKERDKAIKWANKANKKLKALIKAEAERFEPPAAADADGITADADGITADADGITAGADDEE